MKLIKVSMLLASVLGAFYSAQAGASPLAKAFYAEASEAGKRGELFDEAAIDRILSPGFVLDCNNGQLVFSQSELKVAFTNLKEQAGGWTISHLLTLPSIQEGACARILFLWSVPGKKDLIVDAHLYSSTGEYLDKMVATVAFKDDCFRAWADGFLEGTSSMGKEWGATSRDAVVIFDPATNSLILTYGVANRQGGEFDLSVSVREHQEKSDKINA
jgi:hypothetical protein